MIEQFLRFDISIFSILLLLMVRFAMFIRKETIGISNKLFTRIVWINILMLILEILSWQFDRLPGQMNYILNYGTNMLFAWSVPLISAVWASYIDYKMFEDMERLKRRRYYMWIMVANTVLIGLNFKYPLVFSVDSQNVYSREPYMWLIVFLNGLLLIRMVGIAYYHREKIQREVVYVILLFVFAPCVAAAVQVLVFGAFILWPIMAVTVVLTYIFLETISTSNDYLTGLYSRFRVDQMIDHLLVEKKDFGVIMIDLNNFKMINDEKGHREGDRTLVAFSKHLQKTFYGEKMIARYGGDEFIIVTKLLNSAKLNAYIKTLEQSTGDLVAFSLGYQGTDTCEERTYEALVNSADFKMYEHKTLQKFNQ